MKGERMEGALGVRKTGGHVRRWGGEGIKGEKKGVGREDRK